ncbi:hypothetical protein DVK02_01040 [Halobellus sp. Atlit-31R]|nr:hypothetical protein DVK02_01040 [Halobellus sp. Atlit-31R]
MTSDVAPPELDLPDGWRLVSEELTTPFDVRVVRIEANTRIYEDVALRDRLDDVTGTETTWRFVFASRLHISPATSPSTALTRLVEDRATAKFVDVLKARGFSAVERADTHRIDVDHRAVEATRYRARVRVDGSERPVEAYFAAWPDGTEFLLGGGAYPLTVPEPETFDPERARSELFEMLRSIE